MRKLIVLGTVLALGLALEVQAHSPAVWIDLPGPVPIEVRDGTLDEMFASSTYWRISGILTPTLLSQYKAYGNATYSVRFDGQDALLGMLDSEQIERQDDYCIDFYGGTRMPRYALWVHAQAVFVDLTRTDCAPCLTNPNGADCSTESYAGKQPCLLPQDRLFSEGGGGFLERGTLHARMYRLNAGIPGGYQIDELENLVIRYRYEQHDNAVCATKHSHKPGLGLHVSQDFHRRERRGGVWGQWYLMSALRSGTVSTSPADPPADPDPVTPPADPVTPTVDPAVLQARIDSLNALLVGQADQLKILSAENARLAAASADGGTVTVTIRDTVEVATVDTLLYCPKTNDELNDLFETFTGLADSTDAAGAGKAVSSVQLRSWGAIKALIAAEGD